MSEPKQVSTIILAAGSGDRFGGKGKAFVEIGGETYLDRAIRCFSEISDQLIITLHAKELSQTDLRVYSDNCHFLEGGKTRQESFEKALEIALHPVVLLQDVARPATSLKLIRNVLKTAEKYTAVAPVVSIKSRDAFSYCEDGFIAESVNRENLVSLQTPQAYDREMLIKVIKQAKLEAWAENSVVPLVKKAGFQIMTVDGDPENIKVTYPEDAANVEKYIKKQEDF